MLEYMLKVNSLNSQTFPTPGECNIYIYMYVEYCNLLYARVGVGCDLQVSKLPDFEGSETLRNCIPRFL